MMVAVAEVGLWGERGGGGALCHFIVARSRWYVLGA